MGVQMHEQRMAIRDHIKREVDLLRATGLLKPRCSFPEVDNLCTNGVRGVDLLDVSFNSLVSEVGLTRLAASCTISARDAFL